MTLSVTFSTGLPSKAICRRPAASSRTVRSGVCETTSTFRAFVLSALQASHILTTVSSRARSPVVDCQIGSLSLSRSVGAGVCVYIIAVTSKESTGFKVPSNHP